MALQTTIDAIESLPLFAAARRTDPPTSKAAAANAPAFKGQHARLILEALAVGPGGQTEIARRCGLNAHQVGKRLGELRDAGLIRYTGEEAVSSSGNREKVYGSATA